jgi:hypothetical protein
MFIETKSPAQIEELFIFFAAGFVLSNGNFNSENFSSATKEEMFDALTLPFQKFLLTIKNVEKDAIQ